jgi:hypothetical protein
VVDLLDIGSKWLADQRAASAARQVSYQRGEQSIPIAATPGRDGAAAEQVPGSLAFVEDYDFRDWLIRASDLVLNGELTLPEPGDRIIDTQNGQPVAWEVWGETREKCYRTSGPGGWTLRIHTKRVAGSA